ncbi:hypothetical protein ACOMHN_005302 [Nucella lapillus]
MKKGKYDAGVIEKLINIVRQHPVLYDAADDKYSNQDIKNNIWESIQKKMNMANVTADDKYSNQDIKNNIWESIQKKMNMANVTAEDADVRFLYADMPYVLVL